MTIRLLAGSCSVAVMMAGAAISAQQPEAGQTPAAAQQPSAVQATTAQQPRAAETRTTIVGCVQSRSAYMQSQATAGARVGNTGAGGSDFVLIQASPSAVSTTSSTTAPFSVEPGGTVDLSAAASTTGTKPAVEAQAKVDAPPVGTSGTSSTSATTGTSGTASGRVAPTATGSVYGLTGHAAAELRTLSGKRVEIVGSMAPASNANANPSARTGGAAGDMQMLTVVSVREVPGTCPAL